MRACRVRVFMYAGKFEAIFSASICECFGGASIQSSRDSPFFYNKNESTPSLVRRSRSCGDPAPPRRTSTSTEPSGKIWPNRVGTATSARSREAVTLGRMVVSLTSAAAGRGRAVRLLSVDRTMLGCYYSDRRHHAMLMEAAPTTAPHATDSSSPEEEEDARGVAAA